MDPKDTDFTGWRLVSDGHIWNTIGVPFWRSSYQYHDLQVAPVPRSAEVGVNI